MTKKLIEKWFPVKEISRDAGIEMSYKSAPAYIKHAKELGISGNIMRNFFDPKIRNLHPWFARRPCSAARAITLASIFTENVDKNLFMNILGWNMKKEAYVKKKYPPLLFYTDPKKDTILSILNKEKRELNNVIICDPMAGGGTIPFESLRLGFKTIAVDYNPVAYLILKTTIEYPAKYGEKLVDKVKEEANELISYIEKQLGSFYPEDTEGYIFARGIECPCCKGVIPLIHSSEITKKYFIGFYFNKDKKAFVPYISKLRTDLFHIKRGEIVCPYCNHKIKKVEAYKIWTKRHTKILGEISKGEVKEEEILSTYIILIRQTKNGYKVADDNDFRAFLEACKYLSSYFNELQQYLPMETIPEENEVFRPIKNYGIKYWYQLFNPRQLLSIALLVKYVNERTNTLKSTDEIGKASMLYLALGISRVIDYNSVVTTWKQGTIRDTLGQYARSRKISYAEEYCEAIVPRRNLRWIFEPNASEKTQGGIVPVLNEICKRLEGNNDKIKIIRGDCRKLSSLINEKLDLINVDPPYFDTHIYSDISEYFWQVLKASLKNLINAGFLFNSENAEDWKISSASVPREGELIVRRSKKDVNNQKDKFGEKWYAKQMAQFFKECFRCLKEEGLLVVWFTHKTLNAWKSIISALYSSNFYVSRIWPITTELLTRLVAKKNNNVLDRTLIIVARKKRQNIKINMEDHAIELAQGIADALREIGTSKNELRTFLNAAVMSSVTVLPLKSNGIDHVDYCYSKLIPEAMKIANKIIPQIEKTFQEKIEHPLKVIELRETHEGSAKAVRNIGTPLYNSQGIFNKQ
jgi:adenine-specific DNA methylase